jgi:glyoxylase-like metal-dependent hydrolase (beta-lactamase superfamily II)
MFIQRFVVGPVMTNCYLLGDEATKEAAFIDPGESGPQLAAQAAKGSWHVSAILLTHGHFDHIAGIESLLSALGEEVPVYIHRSDYPEAPASFGRGISLEGMPNVHFYDEGDTVQVGGLTVEVLATPGHTRGGVTLKVGDALFTGDTLFAGSMGRTDFATSDEAAMFASLRKLSALEGDFRVFPGHEGESTLDRERQRNPYIRYAQQGL